jgi:hypothetical protein
MLTNAQAHALREIQERAQRKRGAFWIDGTRPLTFRTVQALINKGYVRLVREETTSAVVARSSTFGRTRPTRHVWGVEWLIEPV